MNTNQFHTSLGKTVFFYRQAPHSLLGLQKITKTFPKVLSRWTSFGIHLLIILWKWTSDSMFWLDYIQSRNKTTFVNQVRKKGCFFLKIINDSPQDVKILGWYPAGSVLPHGKKVPLLDLVGHPSSDGAIIEIIYGVDALLCRPGSHPIFSYWVGWNWIWFYC